MIMFLSVPTQAYCVYNGINYSCGAIVPNGNLAMECCDPIWKECFWKLGWRCPPCCNTLSKDRLLAKQSLGNTQPDKIDKTNKANKTNYLPTYVSLAQFNSETNKFIAGKFVDTRTLELGNLILWYNDNEQIQHLILTQNSIIKIEPYAIPDNQQCCDNDSNSDSNSDSDNHNHNHNHNYRPHVWIITELKNTI